MNSSIPDYLLAVAKHTAQSLLKDNCFRFSAALSFYALFSIAPIIFISVYVAGFLASDVDFQQQITNQFSQLIGERGARGIEVLMETLDHQEKSRFQLIVGIIILVFSATNMFVQIQISFNEIYSVRAKTNVGVVKQILNRLLSLGIILSLGFLLIVSLVLDSVVLSLHEYLLNYLNDSAVIIVSVTQYILLVFLVVGVIFSLFHFLPDVTLPKRYKVRGSVAITVMLLLGKYGISQYIASSSLSDLGGASASVIVLMLWIYYSSIILFLGAESIKAMAELDGEVLHPRRYAERIKEVVLEH
ncbi:YihY/virulence factor BrkB family protein [Pseudomaricurvus sp.]|uniref:YihY/virulence factor BrkB family protein n=1 Tax=Pseudomaricurvus sp. TaxID=2004510 RepID=UPI003F6A692C